MSMPLSECPARTGVPVDSKRCTVHTARGAHECLKAPDSHYEHVCRCRVRWWSTSPVGTTAVHVGDGTPFNPFPRAHPEPPEPFIPGGGPTGFITTGGDA